MGSLGNGLLFWWSFPAHEGGSGRRRQRRTFRSSSPESINIREERRWLLFDFPVKQAAIAASLALTGDAIAQLRSQIVGGQSQLSADGKDETFLSRYDWLRSLRMTSYGFLLYGPGSFAWYQFLDKCMPTQSFVTLSKKVILNQIILGPCVIAVIFAWNNLWLGKLSQLPAKYKKDALPTLLYGFRFWIPVSILNFGVLPLSARVAFMSTCSIFWNFYLSSTMSS